MADEFEELDEQTTDVADETEDTGNEIGATVPPGGGSGKSLPVTWIRRGKRDSGTQQQQQQSASAVEDDFMKQYGGGSTAHTDVEDAFVKRYGVTDAQKKKFPGVYYDPAALKSKLVNTPSSSGLEYSSDGTVKKPYDINVDPDMIAWVAHNQKKTPQEAAEMLVTKAPIKGGALPYTNELTELGVTDVAAFQSQEPKQNEAWYKNKKAELEKSLFDLEQKAFVTGSSLSGFFNLSEPGYSEEEEVQKDFLTDQVEKLEKINKDFIIPSSYGNEDNSMKVATRILRSGTGSQYDFVVKSLLDGGFTDANALGKYYAEQKEAGRSHEEIAQDFKPGKDAFNPADPESVENYIATQPRAVLNAKLGEKFVADMEGEAIQAQFKYHADQNSRLLDSYNHAKDARAKELARINQDRRRITTTAQAAQLNVREQQANEQFENNPDVQQFMFHGQKMSDSYNNSATYLDNYPGVKAAELRKAAVENVFKTADVISRGMLGGNAIPSAVYGTAASLVKSFVGTTGKETAKTLNTWAAAIGLKDANRAYLENFQLDVDHENLIPIPQSQTETRTVTGYKDIPQSYKNLAKEMGWDPSTMNVFGKPETEFNYKSILPTIGSVTGNVLGQAVLAKGIGGAIGKASSALGRALVVEEVQLAERGFDMNARAAGLRIPIAGRTGQTALLREMQTLPVKNPLALTEHAKEIAGTFGSTFASTYGSNWQQAISAGLDDDAAHSYASLSSFGTAMTEMINPDVRYLNKLAGRATGEEIRKLSSIARNVNLSPTQRVLNFMGEFATTSGKETAEELLDVLKTHGLDAAYNINSTGQSLSEDMQQTAVQTLLGTIPMSILGGMGHNNRLTKEAMWKAGLNPQALQVYYDGKIANAKPQQVEALEQKRNETMKVANTMKEIIGSVPETNPAGRKLAPEEKMEIAYHLFNAAKLNQDSQAAPTPEQQEELKLKAQAESAQARQGMSSNKPAYILNGSAVTKETLIETMADPDYKANRDKFSIEVHNDIAMQAIVDENRGDLNPEKETALAGNLENQRITEREIAGYKQTLLRDDVSPEEKRDAAKDLVAAEKKLKVYQSIGEKIKNAGTQAPASQNVNTVTNTANIQQPGDVAAPVPGTNQENNLSITQPAPVQPATVENITAQQQQETDRVLSGEAAQRREDGKFEVNGVAYTRNEVDPGITSRDGGEVMFSSTKKVPYTFKLVEADRLQPSHSGGIRNPAHFIPEVQPKNRTDAASINAENGFATAPRFGELGANATAYSGAPVVNQRDEVIQGHNRSAGLRRGYRSGNVQYKNDLIANAEQFGFTKEQVNAMKNPVLVRQVAVSDQEAIELGNYDVKDTETGGTVRIDPVTTSRKMGFAEKGNIAAMLFTDSDQTLNQAIRGKQKEILGIVSKYLSQAQLSYLTRNGELTPKGAKDLEELVQHFMFEGAHVDLAGEFEKLSHVQKEGLRKSLPSILSTSPEASILPEVQNSITALRDFENSGLSNWETWLQQPDMFAKNKIPSQIYTPTELAIAENLKDAKTQGEIKQIFAQYAAHVKGTPGDIFAAATPGKSKAEAIRLTFNTQYDATERNSAGPDTAPGAAATGSPDGTGNAGTAAQPGTGQPAAATRTTATGPGGTVTTTAATGTTETGQPAAATRTTAQPAPGAAVVYTKDNLPQASGDFAVVQTVPYEKFSDNKFRPDQQLKFNQGTYEPVRIVGDPELISLIEMGSKRKNGKGRTINEEYEKQLEKKYGTTTFEAYNRARQLAKENRSDTTENIIIIGSPQTTQDATQNREELQNQAVQTESSQQQRPGAAPVGQAQTQPEADNSNRPAVGVRETPVTQPAPVNDILQRAAAKLSGKNLSSPGETQTTLFEANAQYGSEPITPEQVAQRESFATGENAETYISEGGPIHYRQGDLFNQPKSPSPDTTTGTGRVQRVDNRRKPVGLPRLRPGETARVERQFRETQEFNFTTRTNQIQTAEDVAFIFRSLENSAVEQAFVVVANDKGEYFVQWLGMGGITGAVVDPVIALASVRQVEKPTKAWIIHNHPSGNLKTSEADNTIIAKYDKIFKAYGVQTEGIVINLRSGEYLTFTAQDMDQKFAAPTGTTETPVDVHAFDRQVFLSNESPTRITGEKDVAAYLSQQRYSIGDKLGIIVLDNNNNITGNFIERADDIGKLATAVMDRVSGYGGKSVIFYTNSGSIISPAQRLNLTELFGKADIKLLDFIRVAESPENLDGYQSLIHEEQPGYNTGGQLQKIASEIQELAAAGLDAQQIADAISGLIPGTKAADVAPFMTAQAGAAGAGAGGQQQDPPQAIRSQKIPPGAMQHGVPAADYNDTIEQVAQKLEAGENITDAINGSMDPIRRNDGDTGNVRMQILNSHPDLQKQVDANTRRTWEAMADIETLYRQKMELPESTSGPAVTQSGIAPGRTGAAQAELNVGRDAFGLPLNKKSPVRSNEAGNSKTWDAMAGGKIEVMAEILKIETDEDYLPNWEVQHGLMLFITTQREKIQHVGDQYVQALRQGLPTDTLMGVLEHERKMYDRATTAVHRIRSDYGRLLGYGSQNAVLNNMEDLGALMSRVQREAMRGASLSKEQMDRITQEWQEMKDAMDAYQARVDELQAENSRIAAELEAERARKVAATSPAKPGTPAKDQEKEGYRKQYSTAKASIRDIFRKLKNQQPPQPGGNIVQEGEAEYETSDASQYIDHQVLIDLMPHVKQMFRSLVAGEGHNMSTAVSMILSDLRAEGFTSLTQRNVHDMVSGYGLAPEPKTRPEVEKTLAAMKQELELLSKLADAEQGIAQTPKQRAKQSEKVKDLKARIRAALNSHGMGRDLPQSTTSAMDQIKTRYSTAIKNLEKRIAEGDYTDRKPPALELDAEAKRLRAAHAAARERYEQNKEKDRLKALSWYSGDMLALRWNQGIGTIWALKAGFDLSAFGRQGYELGLANPKAYQEMLAKTYEFRSTKKYDEWQENLTTNDFYFDFIKPSGLFIADQKSADMTAREEQFKANFLGKYDTIFGNKAAAKVWNNTIAGAAGFAERAYAGGLNVLRYEVFKAGVEQLLKDGQTMQNNPAAYKSLALYINHKTGRGDLSALGIKGDAAKLLGKVFFSPSFMAKNINLINYWYWKKLSRRDRMQAVKDFGKFMIFNSMLMSLAALAFGADVEDDPTKKGFGILNFDGDTVDFWGGYITYINLIARLTTDRRGDDPQSPYDQNQTLNQFIRGKMSPVAGATWSLLTGANYINEPVNLHTGEGLGNFARDLGMPMFLDEAMKIDIQENPAKGVLLNAANMFGWGVRSAERSKNENYHALSPVIPAYDIEESDFEESDQEK